MSAHRLTPPDGGRGTTDHVLEHHGRQHGYRVHLPPALPVGAALVIQLHGGGGNGRGLDRLTRFHDLADQQRFAVVSPSGHARFWNDGRDAAASRDVDDVGFMAALTDCVAQWSPINRRRVCAVAPSPGRRVIHARSAATWC